MNTVTAARNHQRVLTLQIRARAPRGLSFEQALQMAGDEPADRYHIVEELIVMLEEEKTLGRMAGDEPADRYHIVEELIILLEAEQAQRRTEATMAKQLVWWLFAHDLSNGQTRALLKDMSTAAGARLSARNLTSRLNFDAVSWGVPIPEA